MELRGRPPAGLTCHVTTGDPDLGTVERLLRSLPGWFGIESSIVEYVAAAAAMPAYLAWAGAGPADRAAARPPVGVLLATRHFPWSAEIYLMAVDPAVHRRGVGRCLVRALEADLAAAGVEFLQVKTLGLARPDAGYERTRRFYAAMGFRPLEEISELWPENPCLIMIKALQRPGGSGTATA